MNNNALPRLDCLCTTVSSASCVADVLSPPPCLGEVLYGAVRMASVVFNGRHVSVDRARVLRLATVWQQPQGLLTLA